MHRFVKHCLRRFLFRLRDMNQASQATRVRPRYTRKDSGYNTVSIFPIGISWPLSIGKLMRKQFFAWRAFKLIRAS